jgi:hypothetical protein
VKKRNLGDEIEQEIDDLEDVQVSRKRLRKKPEPAVWENIDSDQDDRKDGMVIETDQHSSEEETRPMEYTPARSYTLGELLTSSNPEEYKEPRQQTPVTFTTCLEPYHIANLNEIWHDRINPMLLDSDTNVLPYLEKDSERFLQFQTFFSCPRSKWHTNKVTL